MKKVLIAVSWPYANGEKHIGQIAGTYLPADIFARYNRLSGHQVLMISGSDMHGTPIMLMSEKAGQQPAQFATFNHEQFVDGCKSLDISFDIFTHTHTKNHAAVVSELFKSNMDAGIIDMGTSSQAYDIDAERFLPDRYVEGSCPHCGYEDARGDQCDECGKIVEPSELKNIRSKLNKENRVEFRETEHFYIDLAKNKDALNEWLDSKQGQWNKSLLGMSLSMTKSGELPKRSITRDLDWGVDIPVEGFDKKRFYVWYEAVIGYLSATVEACNRFPEYGQWQDWISEDAQSETFYFIGKDNIPFHSIIWPSMIFSSKYDGRGVKLPDQIISSDYLTLAGSQFSTSRGHVIGFNTIAQQFQTDSVRYALASLYPQSSDVEFTWEKFAELINNELIANWGNLVSRTVNFVCRKMEGKVEFHGEYSEASASLLKEVTEASVNVREFYAKSDLRGMMRELLRATSLVNKYFNDEKPWEHIKEGNNDALQDVIYTSLAAIQQLNLLWAPIVPNAAQAIHDALGGEGQLFSDIETPFVGESDDEHKILHQDPKGYVSRYEDNELPHSLHITQEVRLFDRVDVKAFLED